MIDLHCHVLPGIDDGPSSMQETLDLARAAHLAGIETLVATPHVSSRIPTSACVMEDGVAAVKSRLAAEDIGVLVRTGGEIDVVRAAQLDDAELSRFHLGGGEWLLMECPLGQTAAGSFDLILHALQARGHRIVLAHPERSVMVRRRPELLEQLIDDGMLSSITAGSLAGRFGGEVQRFSVQLLEKGLVHNITSDAHDAVRRPPGLRDELLSVADELPTVGDDLEWLTVDVPRAILGGGPVPPRRGAPLRRKRRLRFIPRRG